MAVVSAVEAYRRMVCALFNEDEILSKAFPWCYCIVLILMIYCFVLFLLKRRKLGSDSKRYSAYVSLLECLETCIFSEILGIPLAIRLSNELGDNRASRGRLFQVFSKHGGLYPIYLLDSKRFRALAAQKVAHKLWTEGKRDMAIFIQKRVSDVYAVDICPQEKIELGKLIHNETFLYGERRVAVLRSKVHIYREKSLAVKRARHPANVVRKRLKKLYEVYYHTDDIVQAAIKVYDSFCGRLFGGVDVSKKQRSCKLDVGAAAFRNQSRFKSRDVQLDRLDQADSATGAGIPERAVVKNIFTVERPLADAESTMSSASSQIPQKYHLKLPVSGSSINLPCQMSTIIPAAKHRIDDSGAFYQECSTASIGDGSTAYGSQPHTAESFRNSDFEADPESANSLELAPTVLNNASSADGQSRRASSPPGNSGEDDQQPPPDRSRTDTESGEPSPPPGRSNQAARLDLSSVAKTFLVISGTMGIASSTIPLTSNTPLSGRQKRLLALADIFCVAGFFLCLSCYISHQGNRTAELPQGNRTAELAQPNHRARARAGLVAQMLTAAGCFFTTCGFLLIMGTQFA